MQIAVFKKRLPNRYAILIALIVFFIAGAAYAQQTEETTGYSAPAHMSETLRQAQTRILVVPGVAPGGKNVAGSYDKDTPGLIGGMNKGEDAVTLNTSIGGANVNFPVPILVWPARIIGGISGMTQKQLQEFRDKLTEELLVASGQPLQNAKIAHDVFRELRQLQGIESRLFSSEASLPADVDAVIYVNLKEMQIEVDGRDAILTTVAEASVNRRSDNVLLYRAEASYSDRDTLGAWNKNDNALWHDYSNYARHHLGRELAAELYGRADVRFPLSPVKTSDLKLTKRNPWNANTKSLTPTLEWVVEETDEGAPELPATNHYTLDIYDNQRLVFSQSGISGNSLTVNNGLEKCGDYRWTVRASFDHDGARRHGYWMRQALHGPRPESRLVGSKASDLPAYTQGFARLQVKCNAK